MKTNERTLSSVMSELNEIGFKEQFILDGDKIKAIASKKLYQPKELKIAGEYRFDGMTNPSDESELYALVAMDDIKGTLVVSGGVKTEENHSLIQKIPKGS